MNVSEKETKFDLQISVFLSCFVCIILKVTLPIIVAVIGSYPKGS
jgi:hypothetical protein